MLPKVRRLSRSDFLRTQKFGTTHHFPHFSIISHPNSLDFPRFAVVTPASLSKKAVTRNRLRRQIYACVSPLSLSHLDIILKPRPSLLNLSRAEIGPELDSALSKVAPV